MTSFVIREYKSTEIPESECKKIEGIVSAIGEGETKDATFTLANNKTFYYINRGLENKFNLKTLRSELLGKKITIFIQ